MTGAAGTATGIGVGMEMASGACDGAGVDALSGFGGLGKERFLVGDVTSVGKRESTAVVVPVSAESWGSGNATSVFNVNPVGRRLDVRDSGGVGRDADFEGLAIRLGLGDGEPGA